MSNQNCAWRQVRRELIDPIVRNWGEKSNGETLNPEERATLVRQLDHLKFPEADAQRLEAIAQAA